MRALHPATAKGCAQAIKLVIVAALYGTVQTDSQDKFGLIE
jgi:hypothetical protein